MIISYVKLQLQNLSPWIIIQSEKKSLARLHILYRRLPCLSYGMNFLLDDFSLQENEKEKNLIF